MIKIKDIFASYKFILVIAFALEILHFIVPNRAFELYDLIANIAGAVIILLINRLIKWKKLF